jgi:hypothetical protein
MISVVSRTASLRVSIEELTPAVLSRVFSTIGSNVSAAIMLVVMATMTTAIDASDIFRLIIQYTSLVSTSKAIQAKWFISVK